MRYEEIRRVITARMRAFSGITQDCIAYPNQMEVFEPPGEGLWCRLNIQHGQAFMAGMADQPYIYWRLGYVERRKNPNTLH